MRIYLSDELELSSYAIMYCVSYFGPLFPVHVIVYLSHTKDVTHT